MARQLATPERRHRIAATAILALCSWSATAFAASGHQELCPETDVTSLDIPHTQLNASAVSHEETSPDAAEESERSPTLPTAQRLHAQPKATLREIFSDTESSTQGADDAVSSQDGDERTHMNTRVPGVSDDELMRYKEQMYRRDI